MDGGAAGLDDERVSAATLATQPDLRLGAATVCPATRRVRGPGGETALDPRAMLVLWALARDAGRVVTREALFRRCWGAATVGDDSLNHAIADVRRAARGAAGGAFRIETVPRTGYRLTVTSADAADGPGEPPPPGPADPATATHGPEAASASGRDRRAWLIAGGGALALAVAGGFVAWRFAEGRETERRAAALARDGRAALREASPEADARAVASFEAATRLVPGDPALWGGLALARQRLTEAEGGGDALAGAVQAAADRALALDPAQVDARSALAQLPPHYGDWTAAEARFRAVLADAPAHRPTQDAYAFFKMAVGRTRESALERLTFSPKEPLDVTHQYRLGYALWLLGRIDDADRALGRALELWPTHPAVWFARFWVLYGTDRPEPARAMAEAAAADGVLPPFVTAPLIAACRARVSRRPEDLARAEASSVALLERSPSLAVNAWLLLTGLGLHARAMDVAEAYLLERGPLVAAVRARPGAFAVNDQKRRKTHMLFTPVAEATRRSPRFAALVERIGLDAYWRAAGVVPAFRAGGG